MKKKAALKKKGWKESLSLLAERHNKAEYFSKSQIFAFTVKKTVTYIAQPQKERGEL